MTTSQVRRDGGHIAYEAHGRGAAGASSSHGMGENRASFRHLVPLLVAAGHRVASVDVRGHGESSAGWPTYAPAEVGADLLAVVRDLDAGPAVLVGSSSGAAAVVFAATDAPELVTGIVQIGAFVGQPKLNPLLRMAMCVSAAQPSTVRDVPQHPLPGAPTRRRRRVPPRRWWPTCASPAGWPRRAA